MKKAKKVVAILFWVTLAAALIYTVCGICTTLGSATSFPWWTAAAFAGIFVGPVLLLEAVVYSVLSYLCKKR